MAFKLTKLIEKMINELLTLLLTHLADCTARVLYPRCGVTICAMPTQLLREKPRSIHMKMRSDFRLLGTVLDHNLTLILHKNLKHVGM